MDNPIKNGAWRSPEARLNGVQEVAGSNPVAPILRALKRVDRLFAAQLWLMRSLEKRQL